MNPRAEKLILVLMFTMIISVMSASMFNIVLPRIRDDFGLTNSEVSWMTSAFSLIYAIGSVTYGKLADSYKLKDLLTFGLIFFVIGSLIGLTAQSYWGVLAGRSLQGIGASVIPATAMLIPIRYFPEERRGRALGTTAVGLALGSALGPVISALIVSMVHWRWLFLVPVLILGTLPYYRKYLDDEKGGAVKNDWLGGGVLALAVALVLLGVTNGSWLYVLAASAALALFIARIRTASEPFVQPGLFRNRDYTLGLAVAFVVNGIGSSLFYLSPLLLSDVYRLGAGWIGLAMVPAAIASAFFGRKAGKLADVRGNTFLFYIASVLLLMCFGLLSFFASSSSLFIVFILIFGTVGQSFMVIAFNHAISRAMPKEQAGVGMGMLALLNFISFGLAAAIFSRVLDLGSEKPWIPGAAAPSGYVYSNIYLVFALLHVGILLFYHHQFGRRRNRHESSRV